MLPAAWARSQPTTAPAAWPAAVSRSIVERLAGREVDARQEDQREVRPCVGDGRLEVLGPDEVLAARGPTTTRSVAGSSPR